MFYLSVPQVYYTNFQTLFFGSENINYIDIIKEKEQRERIKLILNVCSVSHWTCLRLVRYFYFVFVRRKKIFEIGVTVPNLQVTEV